MMYSFFITVHVQPQGAVPGEEIVRSGQTIHTLRVVPELLSTTTFDLSFEVASERLSKFARMFCEPDGSFVWVSPHGEPAWQADGNLYDRDGRLSFVDIKGTCPPREFDAFLAALGWPATRLMVQLSREAVFLEIDEFRRWALSNTSA